MNILLNRSFITLLMIFAIVNSALSEDAKDTEMSIDSEFYFGFSYNLSKLTKNQDANLSLNPGMRLIWNTDTRLNLGLEAALLYISRTEINSATTEFGTTDFSALINTIPIMLIVNMNFDKFDIYGGAGISLTYSVIEAFSHKSISNIMNGSYMMAASYSFNITDRIDLGIESGIYYITDIDVFLQKLNLKMSYEIFSF